MTFTTRTVLGGYLIGLSSYIWGVLSIGDESVATSYLVPLVAAALVAYYLVFKGVKNSSHRLGATVAVLPLFMITDLLLRELVGRLFAILLPALGIVASLTLDAAAFLVAVTVVAKIAASKKIKLAVS